MMYLLAQLLRPSEALAPSHLSVIVRGRTKFLYRNLYAMIRTHRYRLERAQTPR
jgi:hypothetical protein